MAIINKDLLQFSLYNSVAPREGQNADCGFSQIYAKLAFPQVYAYLNSFFFLNKYASGHVEVLWEIEELWKAMLVLHRTKNQTDLCPATKSILPRLTKIFISSHEPH